MQPYKQWKSLKNITNIQMLYLILLLLVCNFFCLIIYFILIYFYILLTSFLVLDPRLKLQYYKEKKWEDKYIEIAQKDLSNLYKTKYTPMENRVILNECPEDSLLQHIYKRQYVASNNDNELDQYLTTPVALYKTDILQWWKVKI
jgi:hypothetical protein